MSPENTPHDSWASVYELAYRQSFGSFYKQLTDLTIHTIKEHLPIGSSIVDFGAGTGRLSIPLAKEGYKVTAVEPSKAMIEQLLQKKKDLPIETVTAKMEDVHTVKEQDMALCVFTVILYLLDEKALKKSIESVSASLRSGGLLLIDIPTRDLFDDFHYQDATMERTVTIQPIDDVVYSYHERLTVTDASNEKKEYIDSFRIRYWTLQEVSDVLESSGFELYEDLSDVFSGSGSRYYLLRKQ